MMDQLSSLASVASRIEPGSSPAFMNAVDKVAPAASTPDDFSNMISQMITETAQALHKAESTSVAGVQGQASIQNVVETVMTAEQMLQAAIAIRDKVTAAYLELSRMAI
jgi:flagellar hook-basal body complex protein FliE